MRVSRPSRFAALFVVRHSFGSWREERGKENEVTEYEGAGDEFAVESMAAEQGGEYQADCDNLEPSYGVHGCEILSRSGWFGFCFFCLVVLRHGEGDNAEHGEFGR